MSVKRCMEETSSAHFTEWMAYDMLDPIGDEREDLRAGIIASTIIRAAYPKADVKPLDFMPDFDGSRGKLKSKEKRQSVQDMQQRMMLASGMSKKKAKK